LKKESKAGQYACNLNRRIERLQENNEIFSTNINECWIKLKQEIHEVAEAIVRREELVKRNGWCALVTQIKNEAFVKIQGRWTRTTKEYRAKRREEKRVHKAKKKAYDVRELEILEELNKEKEYRKFYKKVNFMRKGFIPRHNVEIRRATC